MARTYESEETWNAIPVGAVVQFTGQVSTKYVYHGPRGGKWVYDGRLDRNGEGRVYPGWDWPGVPGGVQDFVVIATGVADTASDDEFKRICGGHDEAV